METSAGAAEDPHGCEIRHEACLSTEDGPPVSYWELTPDERLVADDAGFAEEGFVAIDIDYGRRLLAVPDRYQVWPDVLPRPEHLDGPEPYSDAIAAILQAAVYDGYDAEDLCRAALDTQRNVLSVSTDAARKRQARTS